MTGTDADLRKLTMPQTERILTGFGVAMSQIKSLHRWKRIGLIRELSGAATADRNAEHVGLSRFARSLRVGIQQQMTEQRETANKIFDRTRRLLQDKRQRGLRAFQRSADAGSSENDDSDDDDSTDDDDSDESESEPDSLADELEGAMDEDTKGKEPDEDEERRELDEMRAMMDAGAETPAGAEPTPRVEKMGPSTVPPGKKLVLKRVVTKTYPDGRVEKIEDDVAADVGDARMKHRKFKPDGSVDVDASRDAVMKILYPHGVDPPAYVAGGTVAAAAGGGVGGAADAALNRTIKAPNFVGTADQKADLLRLRRKIGASPAAQEEGGAAPRRGGRIAAGPRGDGGEGGATARGRRAEEAENRALVQTRAPPEAPAAPVRPGSRRFKNRPPRVSARRARGMTFCARSRRVWRVHPRTRLVAAPVTKKALPDYHKFVSRKMDLGHIARGEARGGIRERGRVDARRPADSGKRAFVPRGGRGRADTRARDRARR